jgi:hypothetical protein
MGWLRSLLWGRRTAGNDGGRGRDRTTSEQDYGAQAEIEAHDIDQMIEARSELRARSGRESVGEELSREALRRPPSR